MALILCQILTLPGLLMIGAAVKAAQSERYEPVPCWFEPVEEASVSCGYLITPESRAGRNATLLKLPVLRIHPAKSGSPGAPILHLSGGPGGRNHVATQEEVSSWIKQARRIEGDVPREYIVFSQRGTDNEGAEELDCKGRTDLSVTLGAARRKSQISDWRPRVKSLITDCRARIGGTNRDLFGYSTADSVQDIMALREALGIDQWIVLGISYGTRVALEIARADEAGIAALLLDSVDVPGSDASLERIQNLDLTLRGLERACNEDAECVKMSPDLYRNTLALATELTGKPKVLRLTHPQNGSRWYFELGGAEFLEVIGSALRTSYQTEWIPRAVAHAARNRWNSFLSVAADAYFQSGDTVYGTSASVNCQDFAESRIRAMLQRAQSTPVAYHDYLGDVSFWAEGFCEMWLPGLGTVATAGPVDTSVPTLILSGGLDPVTPERAARNLADALSNAQLRVYPYFSHAVLPSQGCVAQDVAHWLDHGALPAATHCSGKRANLNFVTSR